MVRPPWWLCWDMMDSGGFFSTNIPILVLGPLSNSVEAALLADKESPTLRTCYAAEGPFDTQEEALEYGQSDPRYRGPGPN